jgi:hypothetical protein
MKHKQKIAYFTNIITGEEYISTIPPELKIIDEITFQAVVDPKRKHNICWIKKDSLKVKNVIDS